MRDELVPVACEDGRTRYDVPGAPYAAEDTPAPVRLLGGYDNVWLSHADRGHIMTDDARSRWSGSNGGVGNTVFVDGSPSLSEWVGVTAQRTSGAVSTIVLTAVADPTQGFAELDRLLALARQK